MMKWILAILGGGALLGILKKIFGGGSYSAPTRSRGSYDSGRYYTQGYPYDREYEHDIYEDKNEEDGEGAQEGNEESPGELEESQDLQEPIPGDDVCDYEENYDDDFGDDDPGDDDY